MYEPAAQGLIKSSLNTLKKVVNRVQGDDGAFQDLSSSNQSYIWIDAPSRRLVFLGQVTEDLASRSLFVDQIRCGETARECTS